MYILGTEKVVPVWERETSGIGTGLEIFSICLCDVEFAEGTSIRMNVFSLSLSLCLSICLSLLSLSLPPCHVCLSVCLSVSLSFHLFFCVWWNGRLDYFHSVVSFIDVYITVCLWLHGLYGGQHRFASLWFVVTYGEANGKMQSVSRNFLKALWNLCTKAIGVWIFLNQFSAAGSRLSVATHTSWFFTSQNLLADWFWFLAK